MISTYRVPHNGYIVASATVREGRDVWVASLTLIGHPQRNARRLFRDWATGQGWEIVSS